MDLTNASVDSLVTHLMWAVKYREYFLLPEPGGEMQRCDDRVKTVLIM